MLIFNSKAAVKRRGFRPKFSMNSSIALELSKFSEIDLLDAWRDICKTYADHELTLDKVKAHLENPCQRPESKKVSISLESWEKLREKAAESGISPSKLLEELIESLLPEEAGPIRDTIPPDEPDEPDEDEDDDDEDTQGLPNFAKRYRANFSHQDNYYSPSVNSYRFDNGKLVPF